MIYSQERIALNFWEQKIESNKSGPFYLQMRDGQSDCDRTVMVFYFCFKCLLHVCCTALEKKKKMGLKGRSPLS